MNDPEASHEPIKFPNRYRITVQGHFHPRWKERFQPMVAEPQSDGITQLERDIKDQAALYGLIIKCCDLGLTLLTIKKICK